MNEDCNALSEHYEEADTKLRNARVRFDEFTGELREATLLNYESLQEEIESLKVELHQKEMMTQRKEEE